MLSKKALKPAIKRELVSYLTAQFTMSIRQAYRTLWLSRTVYFYQPDTRRDEPVIEALTDMAERYPRYGFKKLFQKRRRQRHAWNHKRVHRIYC
jgi:putative transposase